MKMNANQFVKLPDGRIVQARAVFVYWFVGKGRVTPYHWQRIFWTAKDRILHNTNHRWAYFLIEAIARQAVGERRADPGEITGIDQTFRSRYLPRIGVFAEVVIEGPVAVR